MLGLRTQESSKFEKFWLLVQKEATKKEMIFFADCGEGNEFETDEMEGEDFCGWLIPVNKKEEFEQEWNSNTVSDKWIDNMIWLEWENANGAISVKFEKYE